MHIQEQRVWIPHGEHMLEGRLSLGRALGGLVCHPHPGYGGSMENNVVKAACLALAEAGASALRFNFSGVKYGTTAEGEGESEVKEVWAAVEFLRNKLGCDSSGLILVGYSFGAWVGLRALRKMDSMLGWVAVAPPVGIWDFSFAKDIRGRKLLVSGNQDQFCPLYVLEEFFESLEDPKELKILEGADHFLWGFEARLTEILKDQVLCWGKGLLD